MTNKMTYVKAIDSAIEVMRNTEGASSEVIERLAELRASIEKRQAYRSTKKNDVNSAFKAVVLNAINQVGRAATVTEILATNLFEVGTSNQKVSAILKQMVEVDKTVIKTVDKKKSYFSVADAVEGETEEVEGE